MKKRIKRTSIAVISASAAAILLSCISNIPIPEKYQLLYPGDAVSAASQVTVAGGHKRDGGNLMYVDIDEAPVNTVGAWVAAHFTPHSQWVPTQDVEGVATDSEYLQVLFKMRDSAEEDAVVASFRYLHKPVRITSDSFVIAQFYPANAPASHKLHVGDVITAVDGHHFKSLDELRALYKNKRPHDTVVVAASRGTKSFSATVPLIQPPMTKTPIIGFIPVEVRTVDSSPNVVHYDLGNLGGPSEGLMLSLEIISQLSQVDITKGYKIAGTGTISPDGAVGQIGGMSTKVITVNEHGADIFFVPKDILPGDTNEKDAFQELKKLNTSLKIVPVASLSEAMNYLSKLPPRKGSS